MTAVSEPLFERYAVAERARARAVELIRERKGASVDELIEARYALTEDDLTEIGLKPGQHCRI
ncbi:MAG: hypothetical protein ACHQAY_16400 [Hyphomicrobiales bacterium]